MDNQSITIHTDKYCVYQHVVDDEVIYVGMGGSERPFASRCRGEQWRCVVESGVFKVVITNWFDSREDAYRCEREMIVALLPKLNSKHIPKDDEIVMRGSIVSDAINRVGSKAELSRKLTTLTGHPYKQGHISYWLKNGQFPAVLATLVANEIFGGDISANEACPAIKRAV